MKVTQHHRANVPIHNSLILITVGRTPDVAELDVNLVFHTGLQFDDTLLFLRSRAEKGLTTTLTCPVIDCELSINVQLRS